MKKHILLALFLGFFIVSCEKDDDHDHDECHECHLELEMSDGTISHDYEIGEFCGDALSDVEANGYTTAAFTHEGESFDAGTYTNVHCEEHAHDDHDDH
tara:strand:- start:324 stop:620 length:297 start_codon:yes stop_codon:yes gene_type:complete